MMLFEESADVDKIIEDILKWVPTAASMQAEIKHAVRHTTDANGNRVRFMAHPDPAFTQWVLRPAAEGPPPNAVVDVALVLSTRLDNMQAAMTTMQAANAAALQVLHTKIDTLLVAPTARDAERAPLSQNTVNNIATTIADETERRNRMRADPASNSISSYGAVRRLRARPSAKLNIVDLRRVRSVTGNYRGMANLTRAVIVDYLHVGYGKLETDQGTNDRVWEWSRRLSVEFSGQFFGNTNVDHGFFIRPRCAATAGADLVYASGRTDAFEAVTVLAARWLAPRSPSPWARPCSSSSPSLARSSPSQHTMWKHK